MNLYRVIPIDLVACRSKVQHGVGKASSLRPTPPPAIAQQAQSATASSPSVPGSGTALTLAADASTGEAATAESKINDAPPLLSSSTRWVWRLRW